MGSRVITLGGVTPTFGNLPVAEAAEMLQGLYKVDLLQLRNGTPGINGALHAGKIRYDRDDPQERWQTIRDLWVSGAGDCEDLAAAVAAELTFSGVEAQPVIYQVRKGLAHAVVFVRANGTYVDPSRTGGM